MRLLGSLIDFERALAGRDDPVADQSDMFARVAHVDLGSFGDVESKLLAAVVVSLYEDAVSTPTDNRNRKDPTLVCKPSDRLREFLFCRRSSWSFPDSRGYG